MKKILLTLVIMFLAISLAGCKKSSSNNLKVSIYLGGYGQIWANTMAREFEKENPGVTVTIEANPDLQSEIPARLENGSDDDLFFSHGIAWEKLAVQGYLEPLDDLYASIVENGATFEDRVMDNFVKQSMFNDHYYKVPWTNGAGGIVYNAKMFRENGWEVPTTYQELVDLVELIDEAKIKVNPNDMKPNAATVKPFIWSTENYYWDYLVFDWWAQLAGMDKINEMKQLKSPEVFNPTTNPELMQAFGAWVDLVAKNPEYSVEDSVGKQYMAAQMDFLNGSAAMIPNAQWLEMEMRDNIDPSVMEMQIMPSPFMEGAKTDSEGNPIKVNYAVGGGDSIIIPKNAPNKELAKKFLLFMAREDNVLLFTKLTNGVMLAMDYPEDGEVENATAFAKSVMDINRTSVKFDLYSPSLLALEGKVSIQWAPEGITPYATYFNHYNDLDYIQNPSTFPELSLLDTFNASYNTVKDNWERWNSEIIN